MSAHAVAAPGRTGAAEQVSRGSLYEEAHREAERHKWIESERQGRDLGEPAIRDWYRRHWPRYCRHRRLEHIRGMKQWREFETEAFGCVYSLIVSGDLLADRILDRMDAGYENLGVLNWAIEWGMEISRVRDILGQIDVNRGRLDPAV